MPFVYSVSQVQTDFPQYTIINPLTPSEQKAAFHVRDSEGTDLCLKVISPNYDIARFNREISALQMLNHPNVVTLLEYTFSATPQKRTHYMIEDFVAGHDLSEDLQSGEPWNQSQAANFFTQLAEGLYCLESHSVVHRDLKPTNIRVRPNGIPVIIDFGLARHLKLADLTNTIDGAALGTPMYFAPEQFNGTKYEIDHRTDIFALGILLYQSLVGHHPFYQNGMGYSQLSDEICQSNAFKQSAEFQTLPKAWKLLISKTLEKDRALRPNSAKQIAAILQKLGNI